MYKVIFIPFLILIFCSCDKRETRNIKYNSQLYKPLIFKNECKNPFKIETYLYKIDTFNFTSDKKNVIYTVCSSDTNFKKFYNNNLINRIPFYRGSIKGSNSDIILITFENQLTESVGYIIIQNKSEYRIVKCYEKIVDTGKSLTSYYKDSYILLWQENNELYDIYYPNQPKEIDINYCILKLCKNGKVEILNPQSAANTLKLKFENMLDSYLPKNK